MTTDPLFSVADRSVFVAGAAGALGQALAYAFAERGAKIIAADIDRARVEAVAEKLPGGGHLVHCFKHREVQDHERATLDYFEKFQDEAERLLSVGAPE